MSWLHGLRERFIDRFLQQRRDRDLAEEIQYHIELETQRQQARGFDKKSAHEEALARFGNVRRLSDAARDERGGHFLRGASKDLRWSVRSLLRHPAFAVLSVLTIALGIGSTTVAFSVLDTLLLRSLPFREADRLVIIEELTAKGATRPPSHPNFEDWRTSGKQFDGVASQMYPSAGTAVVGSEPMRVSIIGLSRRFFAIVGAPPILGREFSETESTLGGPAAMMVSHEFWKTRMGSRTELGTIRLGNEAVPVVGVVAPDFRLTSAADVYVAHERGPGTVRSAHNYVVVARLSGSATVELARTDMRALSKSLKALHGPETEAVDVAITPLHEYLVSGYRVLTVVVFGASALVLLIACTNMLSAQLARGLGRGREVAVRIALGASRGRLVRQLFVESCALTAIGAIVGTAFAFALARIVQSLGGAVVPRLSTLSIDSRVWIFSIVATAITSVLIGLYPALRLTGHARSSQLRAGHGNTNANARTPIWSVLIGFEIATAVVLLIGCSLLVRTMRNILSSDIGFDARNVITASFDPQQSSPADIEHLRAELAALPGVESAAMTTQLPLSWGSNAGPVLRPTDAPETWPALAGFRVISPEYFRVLKQPVQLGRAFTDADVAGGLPVAIVTPGIAKTLWPGENPIGKLIRTNYLSRHWLTVVGLVSEATSWTMPRGSQNEIFTPLAQHPEEAKRILVAIIRSSTKASLFVPVVRERFQAVNPRIAVRFSTMEERISNSAADRRLAMIALTVFALIALILAGIGIYGVMSYSVSARTQEIGVRLALGATPGAMQRQVLHAAMTVALGGVAVGLGGCLLAGRYVQSVLYGVTSADPVAYVSGISFLLITALVGAYLPARRSSRISPLEAIRGE